eukprot:TRINITY_DN424_c2_g1_i1.p1 TRINITY_DN424_c2_g1~~TRINITY_DN424_c2_g1_i1.p1  ORF type:complete len:848 (+),score=203.64 TRINITY_DN424_c2_g1_i1:201-2546(+)
MNHTTTTTTNMNHSSSSSMNHSSSNSMNHTTTTTTTTNMIHPPNSMNHSGYMQASSKPYYPLSSSNNSNSYSKIGTYSVNNDGVHNNNNSANNNNQYNNNFGIPGFKVPVYNPPHPVVVLPKAVMKSSKGSNSSNNINIMDASCLDDYSGMFDDRHDSSDEIDSMDDNFLSDPNDKISQIKRELTISPSSKQQYTNFFRLFKSKERDGFEPAMKFAMDYLDELPPKLHWKVCLEMADLAKRENRIDEARKFYKIANKIQPYACKGWLEFTKMEEEAGNLHRCSKILADGLFFCPHSESLLVKGIKHNERVSNISAARSLLARLKNVAIERSWRTIMEGGLLEARLGNFQVARCIFKYLMDRVPSYGPIYTEAVRLEMRIEDYNRALKLVEKGLSRIPSYGPLWFLALKIEELMGLDYEQRVKNAIPHLSKELVWKLYFELAQIYDRRGDLQEARKSYVQSVLSCPAPNLVWKIWLGGARTELHKNNVVAARKLLLQGLETIPTKVKATALLECARTEEYLGFLEDARYVLFKAKKEICHEWKVYLEAVLLEMRAGFFEKAIKEVNDALEVHSSTGRLWAVLIQLTYLLQLYINGQASTQPSEEVLRRALRNVPKSGEVWCEGARIALNLKNLDFARKYLDFAIQFTPQYGDSFIELLRLELLALKEKSIPLNQDQPEIKDVLEKIERSCINAEPTYGICWSYCRECQLQTPRQVLNVALKKLLHLDELSRTRFSNVKEDEHSDEKNLRVVCNALDLASSFFGKGTSLHKLDEDFKFRSIFS